MQLIRNNFLLSVDADANKTLNIKGLNGERLYVDTDFNPYSYASKVGVVFSCPKVISNEFINDTKLSEGDKVIFHHFVAQSDNKVNFNGNKYYKADYQFLYAKLEGENIVPLEDYIFLKPIVADDTDKYAGKFRVSFDEGNKKQSGIVYSLSKKAKDEGLMVGDVVTFTHNADYPIKLGDLELYRMRTRKVMLVVRDGSVVVFGDRILLGDVGTKVKFSSRLDKYYYAKVLQGNELVPTGSEVSINKGMFESVTHNGEDYVLMKAKFVNYIL